VRTQIFTFFTPGTSWPSTLWFPIPTGSGTHSSGAAAEAVTFGIHAIAAAAVSTAIPFL